MKSLVFGSGIVRVRPDPVFGPWISVQRRGKDSLHKDKIIKLNSIGFSWDPKAERWEELFSALIKFQRKEGHMRVPQGYVYGKLNLGTWVNNLRQDKENLPRERIKRLDEIGFIWNPTTEQWQSYIRALVNFSRREGHVRVPEGHEESGLKLFIWIYNIRTRLKKGRLSPEQIKELDSLGFAWDPLTEQWETGFDSLKKFRQREGHCLVAQKHIEEGFGLGNWVSRQRLLMRSRQLSPDRLKRLQTLGFVWHAR
jgi:hypothetical protein